LHTVRYRLASDSLNSVDLVQQHTRRQRASVSE
jgi:hypothetical protein